MKILVVDDEKLLVKGIKFNLENEGYTVEACYDGETAVEMARAGDYDLIILDLMMPRKDGLEACQEIRGFSTVPIIMLTARSEDADMLMGFESGADDYVTKPFNPVILGAKVKALLRRTASAAPNQITAGPFTYHTSSLRLFRGDEEIPLTGRENAMMKLFLDNPNRIFSKDMLYELVWGESIVDENAIMVYINRLRQKIEENPSEPRYIRTVRGIGYKFEVNGTA